MKVLELLCECGQLGNRILQLRRSFYGALKRGCGERCPETKRKRKKIIVNACGASAAGRAHRKGGRRGVQRRVSGPRGGGGATFHSIGLQLLEAMGGGVPQGGGGVGASQIWREGKGWVEGYWIVVPNASHQEAKTNINSKSAVKDQLSLS